MIYEYNCLKRLFSLRDLSNQSLGGGASNSCNSERNSVLKFFIVRTDCEVNEREQIALGLFGFLENSLLLFFCKSYANFERSKRKPRARRLRVFLTARLGHIMLYLEVQ